MGVVKLFLGVGVVIFSGVDWGIGDVFAQSALGLRNEFRMWGVSQLMLGLTPWLHGLYRIVNPLFWTFVSATYTQPPSGAISTSFYVPVPFSFFFFYFAFCTATLRVNSKSGVSPPYIEPNLWAQKAYQDAAFLFVNRRPVPEISKGLKYKGGCTTKLSQLPRGRDRAE